MAKIQYLTPEGEAGEIELTAGRLSLGRADDNQIVLAHDSISSHHGELAKDGDTWILTDLGSTNGTKVGGERVEQIELTHGGTFALGNVECVFYGDFEEDASYQEPAYSSAPAQTQSSAHSYSQQPIDVSRRVGFGPPAKKKGSGAGLFIALGILALLACAYAAYSFTLMSA